MEHTKEPWRIADEEAQDAFRAELTMDNCALTVIDVPRHGAAIHVWGKDQQTSNDRARRIVACVNALAGFTTEEIEAGVDLVKFKQERDRFQKLEGRDLREMLRAMQAGELTVSRGIELVDMWLAGNYRDDLLPPVRDGLGEDEMPWDRIDSLTQQRDELQKERNSLRSALLRMNEPMSIEMSETRRKALDETNSNDEGYPGIAHDFETCKRQRDELLAAAQPALEAVEAALGWVSDPEIAKRYRQCGINLRAAIAKVKP